MQHIAIVPEYFQPKENGIYPDNNNPNFEQWYLEKYQPHEGRVYLPIMWTAFFKNNDYGQDKAAIEKLQLFIDSLDITKSYYTICQWDDGVLVDISKKDINVFGLGSNKCHYQLPLICHPHPYRFNLHRDIFCSFTGRDTHPLRTKILNRVGSLPGNYYITSNRMSSQIFCEILYRSVFTLCPRGYGVTSFRVCEALQYGSIPVIISDTKYEPHKVDPRVYSIIIKEHEIPYMEHILSHYSETIDYETIKNNLSTMYKELFTFESNRLSVLKNVD